MFQPLAPRAVVFDLDGLMVDTETIFESAATRLLARRGLPALAPEVLRHMLGRPAEVGFAFFREFYGLSDSCADLIAECRELFYAAIGDGPVPLMPGVSELLDAVVRRGLPAAIATSSSRGYLGRVLGPHGLLARFRFALTRDDVSRGKPDPEIYQKAAARLEVAPAEMVVLEDSLNGLTAAKAAGARCVVVPHALIGREELGAADVVLPSLAAPELYGLLGLTEVV
jgi:HAD superfamily hydrolase (TIGR01509 family)